MMDLPREIKQRFTINPNNTHFEERKAERTTSEDDARRLLLRRMIELKEDDKRLRADEELL